MKKILAQLFLLYFLVMTTYALAYTMTRTQFLPFIPWPVLHYHYGMMAPYQGTTSYNADLLAEGLRDGTWHTINLEPCYPMIRGNKIMYRRMRSFSFLGNDIHKQKYAELAAKLRALEERKGNAYESIRLTWEEWPKSALGWDALRTSESIVKYPIVTIP